MFACLLVFMIPISVTSSFEFCELICIFLIATFVFFFKCVAKKTSPAALRNGVNSLLASLPSAFTPLHIPFAYFLCISIKKSWIIFAY